jgi:2'-hydroxyisoflavone reductase
VWVPPEGDYAGFAQVNIDRAKKAGLTFRSLADTTDATLEYWHSLPADRRAAPRAGCPPELEAKTLAAWHAREKKETEIGNEEPGRLGIRAPTAYSNFEFEF